MWETWAVFEAWLIAEGMWLGPLGALVAVFLSVWGFIAKPFSKNKPTQLAPETIAQIAPVQAKDGPALTVPEFIRLRRELKADLEQELAQASDTEKTQLHARIAELESQIANPDKSLADAQKRIADLEALLDRSGNTIGGDRIAQAKGALEQGDYSIADDIFAEIEANNDLAVQESARAAYGRGEVAEAEIRWHDAYAHYKRASNLDDTTDHLAAYARMTWHLAKTEEARTAYEGLVNRAKSEFGGESPEYASQLNNLALVVQAQGRFPEAEALLNEAREIGRATIGTGHPDYATRLNNLAGVVQAQGRFPEAEALYNEALEIDRATIGMGHPDYATHLSNLAVVVKAQGRFPEAEALYREAREIARATIGTGHPDYAKHLNNLAVVVKAQGRLPEAEALYNEAREIDRSTIGTGHPEYAKHLNNLAHCLLAQDRPAEARPLWEQALEILQATLPADHPNIADVQASLAKLPPK
ncbi:MAG: tetratricopeptide (TPR) repeat protein [Paracoccaceae bacterium]|jgi:tetratricopeptide (TPR) repeat protein